MFRTIKRFLGFTITVQWEGTTFEHVTWTITQALSWARMYPRGCRVTVSEWGRVVAIRVA